MIGMEEAVRDGVAILDEMRPGWASSIDTRSLDMAYGDSCVLGQLYGEFTTGLISLSGRDRDDWALDHGFIIAATPPPTAEASQVYRPLTEAWIRIVEERQLPDWEPSQTQGSQHARV